MTYAPAKIVADLDRLLDDNAHLTDAERDALYDVTRAYVAARPNLIAAGEPSIDVSGFMSGTLASRQCEAAFDAARAVRS